MNLATGVSNGLRKYVGFSFINNKWVLCGTTEDSVVAKHWDEDPKKEVFLCAKVDTDRIIEEMIHHYPPPDDEPRNTRSFLHCFLEKLCS